MVENTHHDAEDHDPSVHHEETDVNVAAILKFTVGFVILAAVLYIGIWFLFDVYRGQERKKDVAKISEVPGSLHRQYPPAPRLQPFPEPADLASADQVEKRFVGLGSQVSSSPINDPTRSTPATDMVQMDREQREEMNGYGWVDRRNNVVRIPIREAKRLLIARGLPVRQEPAAGAVAGQTAAQGTSTTRTAQPSVSSNTIGARQASPVPAPTRPVESPRPQ